jgi:hypothetical protein
MCRHSGQPSQGWRTFLSNHADGIATVDLFVIPISSMVRFSRSVTGALDPRL